MRAWHAHVLNPHLLFFSLSPICLSLEGFLGTYIDQRYRPFNSSLRLFFNNVWIFTGSITGYVGRRYKRNSWTQTKVFEVNVDAIQASQARVQNGSGTAKDVARRQGPPITNSSILI